jgi:hypothetical protein
MRNHIEIAYLGIIFIAILFIFVFGEGIFAIESSQNSTLNQQNALFCLNESQEIMNNMINDNFSVLRINDSLKEIKALYEAQTILKEKKSKYDFSVVFLYCLDIENVSKNAYDLMDQYVALKKFYNDSITNDMNTSLIDSTINSIENEFKSERYENIKPLIDKGYQDITNIKTSSTTLNLFYRATSRSIKDFFIANWTIVLGVLIILIIFFFVYQKTIAKWIIKRKISKLEFRKDTIKELIMKTQRDYFEKGSMSEGNYMIRTKKFAELVRDIERQIPLLREQLMRVTDLEGLNGPKGRKNRR